jgi:iron complex outermembrane receptor protein
MLRIFLLLLIALTFFIPLNSYAVQLAQLEIETTEELLLFFDVEELVIATRRPTSIRKAPAIATVITAKEIRNMGARNLLDILRKVPGLGVGTHDLSVYDAIEIRGIRSTLSEKVLFMIDGHTLNTPVHGSAVITFLYLSADAIKRVEVIRGPGSALYGANAFIGVINVVTKKSDDIKGLQITAGGGSFDTQHYSLLFGHEKNGLKISGYFDHLTTDGPSHFIEQDSVGNSGDTIEYREKPEIGFNIEYKDLIVKGGYLKNKAGPRIGAAFALNDETVQEWEQYYLDIIYDKKITNELNINVRLYGDYLDTDPYWELFSEGFPGYPDGMIGNPSGKNSTLGAEITAEYEFSDHLLTLGGMYEKEKIYGSKSITNFHPTETIPGTPIPLPLGSIQDISDWGNFIQNAKRNIWAVYIQDIWNITDKASLTTGIRYDHYSDFGGTTNPRAGFVWEFMKDTSVKLLYGSAFRAPTFTDLYQTNNPSFIGNPDIKPEEIQTYEAGIEHHFLNKYTARLSYFYNDINNLITTGGGQPPQLENRGGAKVEGIETELLFDFGNDNYGFINYSYQHPVDKETGQRIPDVPAHRANAVINLAPWKYLNTNISISWVGKRYRAETDTRSDIPADTLVDLTLIAKNFHKNLEIRGSIYNLFNEHYLDPNPAPGSVPYDYPANKQMFIIEARYTF